MLKIIVTQIQISDVNISLITLDSNKMVNFGQLRIVMYFTVFNLNYV